MKQAFGAASFFVLGILYKSYQIGELNSDYLAGIKWVLLSCIPYILITIGYAILAKVQGRF